MAPARPKATQATQQCTCQRLCRGDRDLPPRTYRSHKKYRDADLHQKHQEPDNNVPEHTARTQKTDKRHIAHSYSSTGVNSFHTHVTDATYLPMPPLSPTRQPMDLDPLQGPCSSTASASVIHNNNDFYPDNTEEAHEDMESESSRDPITLIQELLPEPSHEKLAIPLAMLQAINSTELEDNINDAELLKTLRNRTSQSDPIDKITQLSIDIFVALIGGSRQVYDGVRNVLSCHDPPIQIHSYHTVQTIVEKITSGLNSNAN